MHTCALTLAGAVDCWGDNESGQANDQPGPFGPYRPPIPVGILSAGNNYTCALKPPAQCSALCVLSGPLLARHGRVVRGLDTISATGNILRDYLTAKFPIRTDKSASVCACIRASRWEAVFPKKSRPGRAFPKRMNARKNSTFPTVRSIDVG